MSDSLQGVSAVVLAGGRGTRLHPYTYVLPKPLVPVGSKPIISHLLHGLRRHGVDKVLRVVTLGTPYGGSELARIAFGANGRQMVPGNDWLTRLAADAPRVETTTIFSPRRSMSFGKVLLQNSI